MPKDKLSVVDRAWVRYFRSNERRIAERVQRALRQAYADLEEADREIEHRDAQFLSLNEEIARMTLEREAEVQKRVGGVIAERDSLRVLRKAAIRALSAPLDETQALDNPAGRALWKAHCADKAGAILAGYDGA